VRHSISVEVNWNLQQWTTTEKKQGMAGAIPGHHGPPPLFLAIFIAHSLTLLILSTLWRMTADRPVCWYLISIGAQRHLLDPTNPPYHKYYCTYLQISFHLTIYCSRMISQKDNLGNHLGKRMEISNGGWLKIWIWFLVLILFYWFVKRIKRP